MKILIGLLSAVFLLVAAFPIQADHRLDDPRRIYALQQQQMGYIHPSRRVNYGPQYYQRHYRYTTRHTSSGTTEKVIIGFIAGAVIGHAISSSNRPQHHTTVIYPEQAQYHRINGRLYQERLIYDDRCRCYESVLVLVR